MSFASAAARKRNAQAVKAFPKYVERIRLRQLPVTRSLTQFCERRNIDPELIVPLVTPELKAALASEARMIDHGHPAHRRPRSHKLPSMSQHERRQYDRERRRAHRDLNRGRVYLYWHDR